jgi:sporulation protein YlmC with PRC-barrel domain
MMVNCARSTEGMTMKQSKSRHAGPDRAISSMVDLKVLHPGGELLGLVDELLIDSRSGRIAYVIAGCLDGHRHTIPWQDVHFTGNAFRLRKPLFTAAPNTHLRVRQRKDRRG